MERSEHQWKELLNSAGFEIQGIWNISPGMESVIEAVPSKNAWKIRKQLHITRARQALMEHDSRNLGRTLQNVLDYHSLRTSNPHTAMFRP